MSWLGKPQIKSSSWKATRCFTTTPEENEVWGSLGQVLFLFGFLESLESTTQRHSGRGLTLCPEYSDSQQEMHKLPHMLLHDWATNAQSIYFIPTHFLIVIFSGKLSRARQNALLLDFKSIATKLHDRHNVGHLTVFYFTAPNCLNVCSPYVQSFAQWYCVASGQGRSNLKSVWTQSPCYFTIHYKLRKRFSGQCLPDSTS